MLLVAAMLLTLFAGCAKKEEAVTETKTETKQEETKVEETKEAADTEEVAAEEPSVSGELTILTHRTDLVDNVMLDYAAEFNKIYPDVEIEFEAMTDYDGEIKIRMNTTEYGDVLMIPNIPVDRLPTFFEPLGSYDDMSKDYLFTHEKMYDGTVYGIPTVINAQGLVYNKAVFAAAGITELPKSPEEFIAAMQMIKDNTDAIPFYTNYAAGWPLGGQYEAQMPGIAGDSGWQNTLPHNDTPWGGEGEPWYVASKLLYDVVAGGLIEEDPTTTDWEACKGMLGRGEIGVMLLGSWSIIQMQEQAENPADIGYMPFPYTNADGKVYSAAGGDYSVGVNVNSENKEAAKAWVTWFIDESGFAQDQTGISAVVGADMPEVLKGFQELGVEFVANDPAPAGEEALLDDVDTESEIGRWSENYRKRILEAAIGNRDESFEDIMNDLNTKWADARAALDVN